MRRPGEVLSRLELLEHAWDFGYENRSNVIDVYVRYLREKIDRPFGVKSIETVRGAGYRLRDDGGVELSRAARSGIRLTLAFTAVMAVVLVAVGLFVYSRVGSDLDARARQLAALARGRPRRTGGRAQAASVDQDRLVASDESLAQVIGPGGRVVYSSPGLGARAAPARRRARARPARAGLHRPRLRGRASTSACACSRGRRTARVVVVGATREDREEALASLGSVLLIGGPIALLLAALAGYGVATAALRPVGAMRARGGRDLAARQRPAAARAARRRRARAGSAGR